MGHSGSSRIPPGSRPTRTKVSSGAPLTCRMLSNLFRQALAPEQRALCLWPSLLQLTAQLLAFHQRATWPALGPCLFPLSGHLTEKQSIKMQHLGDGPDPRGASKLPGWVEGGDEEGWRSPLPSRALKDASRRDCPSLWEGEPARKPQERGAMATPLQGDG